MSNNESNILKDRFKDFGAPASAGVWKGIEANLVQQKKRRIIILWWTVAALVAFSALAVNFIDWDSNTQKSITTGKASKINESTQGTPLKRYSTSEHQNGSSAQQESTNDLQFGSSATPTTDKLAIAGSDTPDSKAPTHKLDEKKDAITVGSTLPIDDSKEKLPRLETTKPLSYLALTTLDTPSSGREIDVMKLVLIRPSPRWQVGLRATGFLNLSSSLPAKSDGLSWAASDPTLESLSTSSHRRYFDLEGYFLYNVRRRFQFGAGLSASLGRNRTDYTNWSLRTRYSSTGIPIYARYHFLRRGKLKLTGELALINEFSTISSSLVSYDSQVNDSSQTLSAPNNQSIPSDDARYAFGLQGTIEGSYQLTSKMSLTAAFGYRKYLVERYSSTYSYGKTPSYFTGSIGLRWWLKE